jgi:quercetin dioxygenase-like cupin family protein
MTFVHLDELEEREPVAGFRVRFVHTRNMTLAYWDIDAGASLPEHSHPHEQVANIIEGEFELSVSGVVKRMEEGSVAIIPPNAPHGGTAITYTRIIDVFYPIREDYR